MSGEAGKGREGLEWPLVSFQRVTAHPEAHGRRVWSKQGRAADSLRSGEVKSNCAASTAAINLSVYPRGRPSLSARQPGLPGTRCPGCPGVCVCLHTALPQAFLRCFVLPPKWNTSSTSPGALGSRGTGSWRRRNGGSE